jgi:small subunit ribosomal protein S14
MAKTSMFAKNERRKRLATHHRERREALRKVIKSSSASDEEKAEAYSKLRELPRDANPNRIRNRCMLTGRPRAVYRKFQISRLMLRKLAHEGQIPGMMKASW